MDSAQNSDLDFLKSCSSEELNILVDVLLYNKDRQLRKFSRLGISPQFIEAFPNHAGYWPLILEEIQRRGASHLALLTKVARAYPYSQIVNDVSAKFSPRHVDCKTVEEQERELSLTFLSLSMQHIPTSHLSAICDAFRINPSEQIGNLRESIVDILRLDDQTTLLLTMIVANGASLYASNVGYGNIAPERFLPLLQLFETPLAMEFEAVLPVSFGMSYQIVLPIIFQLAYLRARKKFNRSAPRETSTEAAMRYFNV